MKRKVLGCSAILGVLVLFVRVEPAKAQLFGIPGLPQIVWDPTTAAEVVKDVAAALQLIQIEQDVRATITNAQQFFTGGYKYQWRGIVTEAAQTYAQNQYGETIPWNNALASGSGAQSGWNGAAMYTTPGPLVASDPRQKAQLASMEITDAAGINALQAVGQSNGDRFQMDSSVAAFQRTVLDGGAQTNSEVQQLNLLTSGTNLGLHYQQLGDNKLSALLQLEAAQAKDHRDQLASQIQFQTDVQSYAQTEGYGLGSCVSCTIRKVIP